MGIWTFWRSRTSRMREISGVKSRNRNQKHVSINRCSHACSLFIDSIDERTPFANVLVISIYLAICWLATNDNVTFWIHRSYFVLLRIFAISSRVNEPADDSTWSTRELFSRSLRGMKKLPNRCTRRKPRSLPGNSRRCSELCTGSGSWCRRPGTSLRDRNPP